MHAPDLLKTWPGFTALTAGNILTNPAWRLCLDLDGAAATLTCRDAENADEIFLSIDLDGEALTLGLSDSPRYPDLHLLWTRRAALPQTVVLALVEKECGDVFKALEAASRRLLSVRGLATGEPSAEPRRAYSLAMGDASLAFSLSCLPTLEATLGRLSNLDCTHAAIRALIRPIAAEYAVFAPDAFDASRLAPGVRLALPDDAASRWCVTDVPDDAFHLRSVHSADLAFAQLADDNLPQVPEPGRLVLWRQGRALAEGEIVRLGDTKAFLVESLVR